MKWSNLELIRLICPFITDINERFLALCNIFNLMTQLIVADGRLLSSGQPAILSPEFKVDYFMHRQIQSVMFLQN